MFLYPSVANGTEETGLVRLPESGDVCPDIIQYRCITTGRGFASLTLEPGNIQLFHASHAEYVEGIESESRLGGDIIIGNLSRSTDMECFDEQSNTTDYC